MTTSYKWLEIDSTASDAETLAYDLGIFNLPVTNDGQFIGILNYDIITNQDIEENKPIAEYLQDLEKFSVRKMHSCLTYSNSLRSLTFLLFQ